MGLEVGTVRMQLFLPGEVEFSSLEGVVRLPVFVLFAEPFAHQKVVVWRDGHQVAIEEAVDVGAHQHAVRNLMQTALGNRFDVGRLERGERMVS